MDRLADQSIALAHGAIRAALRSEAGITPALETQVQNALHGARAYGCTPAGYETLESASAILASMSHAQRNGRPNLYASRRARLTRMLDA